MKIRRERLEKSLPKQRMNPLKSPIHEKLDVYEYFSCWHPHVHSAAHAGGKSCQKGEKVIQNDEGTGKHDNNAPLLGTKREHGKIVGRRVEESNHSNFWWGATYEFFARWTRTERHQEAEWNSKLNIIRKLRRERQTGKGGGEERISGQKTEKFKEAAKMKRMNQTLRTAAGNVYPAHNVELKSLPWRDVRHVRSLLTT